MSLLLVALIVYAALALGGAGFWCAKAWRDVLRAPKLTPKVKTAAQDDVVFGSLLSAGWPLVAIFGALAGLQSFAVWVLITRPRRRAHPHERLPVKDARDA